MNGCTTRFIIDFLGARLIVAKGCPLSLLERLTRVHGMVVSFRDGQTSLSCRHDVGMTETEARKPQGSQEHR